MEKKENKMHAFITLLPNWTIPINTVLEDYHEQAKYIIQIYTWSGDNYLSISVQKYL